MIEQQVRSRLMSSISWLNGRGDLTSTPYNKGLLKGISYLTSWQLAGLISAFYLLWLLIRFTVQPAWLDKLPISVTEALEFAEIGRGVTLAILWIVIVARNRLRRKRSQFRSRELTREQLSEMDQYELKKYVAGLFKEKGYRVVGYSFISDQSKESHLEIKVYSAGKQSLLFRQLARYFLFQWVLQASIMKAFKIAAK